MNDVAIAAVIEATGWIGKNSVTRVIVVSSAILKMNERKTQR